MFRIARYIDANSSGGGGEKSADKMEKGEEKCWKIDYKWWKMKNKKNLLHELKKGKKGVREEKL